MAIARHLFSVAVLATATSTAAASTMACDTEDPTNVVVDNDYPAVPDGGDPRAEMTVFKVWWATSLLPDAVAPGSEGQPQRTVPNTDYAYAVIAPGWDRSSPSPPTTLMVARSIAKLEAQRGDTVHVHVSNDAFTGNCQAGKALSQDDADFIVQRIFPGEFPTGTYDAATCTVRAAPADAGDAQAE